MPTDIAQPNETVGAAITVLHVSVNGNDAGDGTQDSPFRTISAAAAIARPGDTVFVHEGIYRERVDPPRGGLCDAPISYVAAPGEHVVLTGSEPVTGWRHIDNHCWSVSIPNDVFGAFNPYADVIHGDWFSGRGRVFHTGCIYLDGEPRAEARTSEEVLAPRNGRPLWFAEVGADETKIWAQFEEDPNARLVEVVARQTIFYPSRTGCDFIIVRGFEMRHAATPWAPPTAEQIGAIGTNWSKGWVIEDNRISHSRCCGITLGKYGDEFDNTAANTAEGYVLTIERALDRGWSGETIGHHLVRGNRVSHCGQAGIAGSLGCAFSRIVGNVVHDIHLMEHFSCAEEAGLKFHAAIDTEISGNHIYRTRRALWLDWMAQGTRVEGNLMHDNGCEDIYIEVNHGPCLVANNILLSARGVRLESTGTAFAHNLVTGAFSQRGHGRMTPYLEPHGTEVLRLGAIGIGDDRWFNNLLLGPFEMTIYDYAGQRVVAEDNLYSSLAIPLHQECRPHYAIEQFAPPRLHQEGDGWYLDISFPVELEAVRGKPVTSERLGAIDLPRFGARPGPDLKFEGPDGSAFVLDRDYFGERRGDGDVAIGPFASAKGTFRLKVWPLA